MMSGRSKGGCKILPLTHKGLIEKRQTSGPGAVRLHAASIAPHSRWIRARAGAQHCGTRPHRRTDTQRVPAAQAAGQASLPSSANPAASADQVPTTSLPSSANPIATQGLTAGPARVQEFIAAAINRQDALNAKMLAEVFDKLDDDDDGEIGARALSCALQVSPGHGHWIGLVFVVTRGCSGRATCKEALVWVGVFVWQGQTAAMGQHHTPHWVSVTPHEGRPQLRALRAGAGARRVRAVHHAPGRRVHKG